MFVTEAMDSIEIYIPEKAEVKSIKLGDLPKATLRKIKLHPSLKGSTNGKDLASLMAAWISPVALREKCHSSTNQPVDAANNCIALLSGIEQKAVEGPFPMPVVSSNTTAFNFLTDLFSSKSTEYVSPTKTPKLPFGFPPHHPQDAIIIFCGRVYLSVKKPKLNKYQKVSHITREDSPAPAPSAQQVSKSEPLSLSPDAPESQIMATPTSPKHTTEGSLTNPARFGINRILLVSLTKIPPKYMKGLLAARQRGQSRTKVHCIEGGSREEKGKIEVKDERAPSAVTLQSSVVEQDGRLEKAEDSLDIIQTTASESKEEPPHTVTDEASCKVEPPHTGTDEASIEHPGHQEKDSLDRCSAMDVDEPENSVDVYAVGMVPGEGEGGAHGWTSNLPQVPAFSSRQGQEEDFDFELLAREEAISRIKAQLREREAALSNVRDDDCSV